MFAAVSFVSLRDVSRVTRFSRLRVRMFQCSYRCSDTCVSVVLDMRMVAHHAQCTWVHRNSLATAKKWKRCLAISDRAGAVL